LPKSTILGFAKGWKIVHYEAHYQKEWENVKNNMAKMASLLEQLLWAQSRGGTSSQ
jgi:hypothetical protein